ncbi:hypothetical protein [Aquisphaera giovannonii]|uniref:hypothetical protein n=1 Tax=Aquisphaera giovannonii TaxID=406548 RepID=UPI0011DF179A|nr:hypothetical protein [Aquisphaera giovannonii]
MTVENRAGMAEGEFGRLAAELATHGSVKRAIDRLVALGLPLAGLDLIAQDEFSHDLLVPYRDGLYLSYDTT